MTSRTYKSYKHKHLSAALLRTSVRTVLLMSFPNVSSLKSKSTLGTRIGLFSALLLMSSHVFIYEALALSTVGIIAAPFNMSGWMHACCQDLSTHRTSFAKDSVFLHNQAYVFKHNNSDRGIIKVKHFL